MTPISNLATTASLLLLTILPHQTLAILPTAAIDIFLPNTPASNAITLLASQASFGGPAAKFSQRHQHFTEAVNSGNSRSSGVGVVPGFPPEDDAYLCNEAEGWSDYTGGGDKTAYYQSALVVPRGQCSFEHKALSAQRLGASAIIIYGSLSSRYSLNYTNSTEDCASEDCMDAKKRDGYTNKDVIWPTDKNDYDCDYGKAYIPASSMSSLDFVKLPGGYNEENDGMLMGKSENNICVKHDVTEGDDTSFSNSCASQRCLVTGKNETNSDGTLKYEACCAWDTLVWLYNDRSIVKQPDEKVTIPAVYISMEDSTELLDLVRGVSSSSSGGDPMVLSIYERYRPQYNYSAVLIWAFGVFVAWIASYHSSVDLRRAGKAIVVARELKKSRVLRSRMNADPQQQMMVGGGNGGRPRSRSNSPSSSHNAAAANGDNASNAGRSALEMGDRSISSTERAEERTIYQSADASADDDVAIVTQNVVSQHHQEESLELTSAHALGFIVMASTSLLVLFFFKIFAIVKIMYAFGCSGAFAQIIVHPGLTSLCKRLKYSRPLKNVKWLSEESATREVLRGGIKGHCLTCLWSFIGPISPVDIAAFVISYGVGGTWLWVAFTVPHPDTVVFYWVIQDVFGLCMCMLFLETIKLNAIKVGATLLMVAFFYDIFFVFITPLLTKHGESIMVNVATSGGPPKADPSWCEKYPFSADCKGGDPLPMLFAIPRIGDYQGGCSMLGLGDIVLPGLLLSFASRYDESKRVMGLISGGSGRVANNACLDSAGNSRNASCFLCCCCKNGYFGPVMVAYAIGLMMANCAVYIMQMGQPALLYLVPCCLGTMCYMGHKSGELNDLWEGPRVIRAADALLYGEPPVESAEEGQDQEEEERRSLEGSMKNEEEAEMT